MMATRTLSVGDAFELVGRGKSKYTRAYIRQHPGPYAVYSAATTGPLGTIDTFDFEGMFLSWSTNGYAGRTRVIGGKFSTTADRSILRPKLRGLNLEYCRIALEPLLSAAARGRRPDDGKLNEYTKLPADEALAIEFEIPVDDAGDLDIEAQAEHVRRWKQTNRFQSRASELARLMLSATVLPAIPDGVNTSDVSLTDDAVFAFVRKETGWFKKVWRELDTESADDIPVYSAARAPIAHVSVRHAKLIDASPDNLVLSFAVDGDGSAGSNFVVHDRPFYISNKRASLRAIDHNVDLRFVYYSLQTMKVDYGFGFNFKAYKSRLVDVVVRLPIRADGTFDLELQQKLVQRQGALIALRDNNVDILRNLATARVTVA